MSYREHKVLDFDQLLEIETWETPRELETFNVSRKRSVFLWDPRTNTLMEILSEGTTPGKMPQLIANHIARGWRFLSGYERAFKRWRKVTEE